MGYMLNKVHPAGRRRLTHCITKKKKPLTERGRDSSANIKTFPFTLHELKVDLGGAFCPLDSCRNFDHDLKFVRRWKPDRIKILVVLNGEGRT